MTDPKNQILENFVLLLIVVVPLFSLGLSNHGLWSADEPRVAEIGREMALTGNWAVPTLNQKPFLEEPPLYYGSLALAFKVFGGASDKVARIPSALFALAGVMVAFFIANFLFGPRVALLSGIILATTEEYFRVAHWVMVDNTLTFFVICAMGLFIAGYLSESNRKKLLCYILLYISCSLAFFTKGFIGIVIPGLSILTFLIAEKNLKEILKMRLWLGILIFIVMVLPWFIALWHQGGTEYLSVFSRYSNHLQRSPSRQHGIGASPKVSPGTTIPFTITSLRFRSVFSLGAFFSLYPYSTMPFQKQVSPMAHRKKADFLPNAGFSRGLSFSALHRRNEHFISCPSSHLLPCSPHFILITP